MKKKNPAYKEIQKELDKAESLWFEKGPEVAYKSLRKFVYQLRRRQDSWNEDLEY